MSSLTTNAPPTHAPMTQFAVRDNALYVAGHKLTSLARIAGQTPFYVYDRAVIDRQITTLRQYLPESIALHYAIKANPLPGVVQHLSSQLDGLDVASAGELRVALASGMTPANISFAGPGKTDAELNTALASDILVIIESAGEFQRLAAIAHRQGIRARVAVRVNPDFELKSSGMKMAGGAKPFGVDVEQLPALLAQIRDSELDFLGFHIFCGSQNLSAEAIMEAHRNTFALAERLKELAPSPLRWLNIGGGFGVPYFAGEKHLNLAPIGKQLHSLLAQHQHWLGDCELVMELGRYLVAEAGLYVCKVIDIKESRGETFVITDGGLHHHLAASGNFGQVIRKNYPLCLPERISAPDCQPLHIVGPLCTPLDILGHRVNLPRPQIGELVAIFQSGAYGYSASPQGFLSHPGAVELLL